MGRPARYVDHAGHHLTIAEWAKRCGLSPSSITRRLDKMPAALALEKAQHPTKPKARQPTKPQEPPMPTAPPKPEPDEAPKQRTVDFPSSPTKPPPLQNGRRVRVYHRRNTRMFLSDCTLGPNEERDILESDALRPSVAKHVIRLAP